MLVEELLPENSFDRWPVALRQELAESQTNIQVGQSLAYEDAKVRVWSIALEPGQRLPFHRHTCDYSWTSLTPGVGVVYYSSGDAYRVTYERGDTDFYHHAVKGDFLHDLENIGDTVLEFMTVEYI